MPTCAAFGCSNRSGRDPVSFFSFPKDSGRRSVWLRQLNRVRYHVTDHSRLCERHFTDDQFVHSRRYLASIGFTAKKKFSLKNDAVPTLFERPVNPRPAPRPRVSADAIRKKKLLLKVRETCVIPEETTQTEQDDFLNHEPFIATPVTSVQQTPELHDHPTLDASRPESPLHWLADIVADVPRLETVSPAAVQPTPPAAVQPTPPAAVQPTPPAAVQPTPPAAVQPTPPAAVQPTPPAAVQPTPPAAVQPTPPAAVQPTPPAAVQPTPPPTHQLPQTESFSVQCQTPYNLVPRASRGVQCSRKMVNQETQTDPVVLQLPCRSPAAPECQNDSLDDSLASVMTEQATRDSDWTPTATDDEDSDSGESSGSDVNEAKERKFIVFESCLDKLFKKCRLCGREMIVNKRTLGTPVLVEGFCGACLERDVWASQPMSGTMPFGNLILSAALMFAGASPVQVLRLMDFAGIQTMSISTYMLIQQSYLTPAIRSVWELNQAAMIRQLQLAERPLKLGGDARCCTPGHTAKFSSYSLMDLETNKILDIQLLQSNEVRNSYAMEKEGLIRGLNFLMEENHLAIGDLVTDRHSAIKKFMREEHPDINHWFDVWHVAKGVFKKLEAAGKKKGCEKLKAWARSVSNHLYWCAASSDGDGDLVQQKWLSILNHVANVHEGHGNLFPECLHGPLEDRDWMSPGRKPHAELEKVVKGRLLVTDIKKLSPDVQTSSLESFHNLVCSFARKSVHFFHAQMEARLFLAGLHFNENSGRGQAVTKEGAPRYGISFPKSRKGQAVAKEIKVDPSFGYVDELMAEVLIGRDVNTTYSQAKIAIEREGRQRPCPLAQSTPMRPNKEDVIRNHRNRFNCSSPHSANR